MNGTQFAFVGFVILDHETFGMKRGTEEELKRFVYLRRWYPVLIHRFYEMLDSR